MRICLVHSEPERLPRIQLEYQSLKNTGHDAYILSPKLRSRFKPKVLAALLRYSAFFLQVICQRTDAYLVSNCPDIWGFAPVIRRKRWVYDVRSPWAEELRAFGHSRPVAWLAERMERYMTRHADIVLVVNKVLERRAKEWGARRVYMLPNYPPSDFRPTLPPDDFRKQQKLSGKKIVLFVGKFSEVECTLDLVKTLSDMLKEEDDLVLVLAGDGPDRPNVERYLKAEKITDRVLITGWLDHSAVPNWISIADVCVLPRREDMPSAKFYSPHSVRKVGEYLALGKPVIATPVGEFAHSDLPITVTPLSDFPAAIGKVLRVPPVVNNPVRFTWEQSEKALLEAYDALESLS